MNAANPEGHIKTDTEASTVAKLVSQAPSSAVAGASPGFGVASPMAGPDPGFPWAGFALLLVLVVIAAVLRIPQFRRQVLRLGFGESVGRVRMAHPSNERPLQHLDSLTLEGGTRLHLVRFGSRCLLLGLHPTQGLSVVDRQDAVSGAGLAPSQPPAAFSPDTEIRTEPTS